MSHFCAVLFQYNFVSILSILPQFLIFVKLLDQTLTLAKRSCKEPCSNHRTNAILCSFDVYLKCYVDGNFFFPFAHTRSSIFFCFTKDLAIASKSVHHSYLNASNRKDFLWKITTFSCNLEWKNSRICIRNLQSFDQFLVWNLYFPKTLLMKWIIQLNLSVV